MSWYTPQMASTFAQSNKELIQKYALRAHTAIHYLDREAPTIHQVVDLACYIQTAREGAKRQFKTPPKKLEPANAVMTHLLANLSDLPMLTTQELADLREGIICADGVWERLTTQNINKAMLSVRTGI